MKYKLLLPTTVAALFINWCYGQNSNINSNTTIIQNNPAYVVEKVIEKPVYIEKYRTVYVDKPQPKRIARKLSAPIQLYGYLWVYPEDIGNFRSQTDAIEVVQNINATNPYGHNEWRIPTSGELALLENNADYIGLGDEIYLATDHTNGVLRMVSTGETVAQKEEKQLINATRWAQTNVGSPGEFVDKQEDYGILYAWTNTESKCPIGYRIPEEDEIRELINNSETRQTWETFNSINGFRFVNVKTGQSIFMPAAGRATGIERDGKVVYIKIYEGEQCTYAFRSRKGGRGVAVFSKTGVKLYIDDEARTMFYSQIKVDEYFSNGQRWQHAPTWDKIAIRCIEQ